MGGGLYSLPISRSPMWAQCGGQICPLRTVRLSALYCERNDIMVIRDLFEQFLVRKCNLIFGLIHPLSIVRPRQAGKIGIHLSRSAGAEDGQLGHLPICVEEFHGLSSSSGRCAPRRCSVGDEFWLFCGVLDGACKPSDRSVPAFGGPERIRRVRQLMLECVPLKWSRVTRFSSSFILGPVGFRTEPGCSWFREAQPLRCSKP